MALLDSKGVRIGLAVGTTAIAVAVGLARYFLWKDDKVLDSHRLNLLTIATTVAIVLAAAFIYYAIARARMSSGETFVGSRQDSVAVISLLIALGTGVYAAAQIFFPSTPESAAAGACRGAPVQGAPAFGQTTSLGANARAGAGSAYRAMDRFGADCTIGFDGFCLGEPIAAKNAINDLPDQRWLIVHGRSELVSASYIRLQRPQSDLGEIPAKRCTKEFHGVVGPTTLKWKAEAGPNGTVRIYSSSDGSLITSYAVEYLDKQEPNAYPYVWVGAYSPLYGFVSEHAYAEWLLARTPLVFHPGTQHLYVVGEDCYADDAPALATAQFKVLTFRGGMLVGKPKKAQTVPNAEALSREACSID